MVFFTCSYRGGWGLKNVRVCFDFEPPTIQGLRVALLSNVLTGMRERNTHQGGCWGRKAAGDVSMSRCATTRRPLFRIIPLSVVSWLNCCADSATYRALAVLSASGVAAFGCTLCFMCVDCGAATKGCAVFQRRRFFMTTRSTRNLHLDIWSFFSRRSLTTSSGSSRRAFPMRYSSTKCERSPMEEGRRSSALQQHEEFVCS